MNSQTQTQEQACQSGVSAGRAARKTAKIIERVLAEGDSIGGSGIYHYVTTFADGRQARFPSKSQAKIWDGGNTVPTAYLTRAEVRKLRIPAIDTTKPLRSDPRFNADGSTRIGGRIG